MTVETTGAAVYLQGDPEPIITSLSTEQVLARLAEVEELRATTPMVLAFVRLPHFEWDDALVRPEAIAAITSTERCEDEDDDS